MATSADRPELHRALGLFGITVYAIGDILGAGIYALVGRVAAEAGRAAWLSFLVSAGLAALTGLTYAEWVSRHPRAAGAAGWCRQVFSTPLIPFLVGFAVLASGITSAATVSHAFVGYLGAFVRVPHLPASLGLLVLMSVLSYRGMKESGRVNLVLTAVELSGLLLVLVIGASYLLGGGAGATAPAATEPPPATGLTGMLAGVTVAFFAYIGFEDSVNVAEEVRDPRRNLPRAILVAIAVTTAVYVGVMATALSVLPLQTLAASEAPLLDVVRAAGIHAPDRVFAFVALLAITNTGLLNLIMASRLTYGMAHEGLLPPLLGRVHPVRRTPHVAVVVALILAVLLSLSGGTQALAQTTSLLLLLVFTAVHVALIVARRRDPSPEGLFRVPRWVPWAGASCCAAIATRYPWEVYLRTGVVLLVGVLAWWAVGRRGAGHR